MMHTPLCSIIILSYNKPDYTKQCLDSISKYTRNVDYDIIVVDNASDTETVSYLQQRADITLIRNNENLGFAAACNQGIEASQAKYIMLLNNDTIVTKLWLYNMVQYLELHPKVSMAGPLTNATVGKQMITTTYGNDLEKMQEFAAEIAESGRPAWQTLRLVAFCILLRRSLVDEIGLLDTRFAIGNYEDDDYNIRALCKGKQAYICRNSFIHHFMSISFQQKDLRREEIVLQNKLVLEQKWDNMNWNHHAAYNQRILESIMAQGGCEVLHIGCGMGALAIELHDRNPNIYVTGVEDHPIRYKIAKLFVDELYFGDRECAFVEKLKGRKFDTIVIECMIEKTGLQLLDKIKPLLKRKTLILLRIFNSKHITTLERVITGSVGGELLCASSREFTNYFAGNIKNRLELYGYEVLETVEIKKKLTIEQQSLMEMLAQYNEYQSEGLIYNRIYRVRK